MKWTELLAEKLSKNAIFEMAFDRKDVESKITDLSYPVIEHMIKISKWKDDLNFDKHCNDINKWLFKIQSFYIRGKRKPTQVDYFKWMYEDVAQNSKTISRYIRGLHEYKNLPVISEDEEVHDKIKAWLYRISFDLSLNQFEDIRDYF